MTRHMTCDKCARPARHRLAVYAKQNGLETVRLCRRLVCDLHMLPFATPGPTGRIDRVFAYREIT